MNRVKNIILVWGLLAALNSWWGCGTPAREEHQTAAASVEAPPPDEAIRLTDEALQRAGIEIGPPLRHKLTRPLRVVASVEVPPQSLVSVHAPAKGFVRTLKYLPGDYVRKGTLLCTLTHPELVRMQRDYLKARARLKFLEAERTRKETLAAMDATSRRAFEEVTAEYEATLAEVKSLRTELQLMGLPVAKIEAGNLQSALAIHAPLGGYVAKVAINKGKLVQPEDLLYEIVDDSHVHLELQVFAKDLPLLRKGQRVLALAPDGADTLRAEVHLISHRVDADKGTALVHAHFAREPVAIAPGTILQALVLTEAEEVWALPEEAVIREGDKHFIYLRQPDGTFSRKEIVVGRRANGLVEWVDCPAEPPAQVVRKGAYYLHGIGAEAAPD